ncbi:MAG: metal-sensing transcriptional repressor [Candidatus Gracilibacteria bacterium]|jgi:DNA-binding FrmR family transcriptional regulator|nr:metal-sensing transcriptional repressor [Candidatus Gracilibacteria bacterium]
MRTPTQRLNIIKGQIDGLSKIIDRKGPCKKVMEQYQAIISGLRRTIELHFKENIGDCLEKTDKKTKEEITTLLESILKSK